MCIVRGSINTDEYFYVRRIVRPGETISSRDHKSRVGGKGANQAIAIARAGGNVQFYGTIGQDGLWLKDKMSSLGMDGSQIIICEDPTGRAIIQVTDDGENSIILFPGANHSVLHEQLFAVKSSHWFPEATHLLLQNEIALSSTHYALENARRAVTILNPSPLPSKEEILEFPWHKVDWLIVNEPEAYGLYIALSEKRVKHTGSMSTRELVFELSTQPPLLTTNIICTLGPEGVLAFIPTFHRPEAEHDVPSFMHFPVAKLQGEARDTTGAGDCFTGYFVQGLMEFGPYACVGKEIRETELANILRTCVQAAGMCVEKPGTIDSIPTRSQVESRMSSVA